ncbi:MAG: hypothetical protein M3P16_02510 [Chloroflexota bacterium]|nr:hypothetical protein [Chloroflexota bacterium]
MIAALQRPGTRPFLTSAIVLYTELLLIRWIPAYVGYVLFFSNLVVIASFLGIGIGILIGRRTQAVGLAPYGPALVLIALLVLVARIDLRPGTDDVLGALIASHAADPNLVVLTMLFVAVAVVLATLSLPLGPLLRAFPPLRAYAIDIGGAIAGIVAFTAVSALGAPPTVWFALLGIALGVRGAGRLGPASVIATASLVAVVTLTVLAESVSGDIWSPYYRISLFDSPGGFRFLAVNGIPHQNFYPVSSPRREAFYDQVYRWFPDHRFARVLIIGAGNGTDVAGALAHGATSVDAVEIDPRILDLGRMLHPDRPYADPRVRTIVDDGRAELRRSDRTYDLIVFALTDSLTLSSSAANLRLESFLYTDEALASARARLAPDGVITIYNYYSRPFLVAKLAGMLANVFGAPPIVRTYSGAIEIGAAFAAGPGARAPTGPVDTVALDDAPPPATDDWPFLYLEAPGVAPFYVLILGAFLAVSLLRARRRVPAPRDQEPRDVQPSVREHVVRQCAGLRGHPAVRARGDRGHGTPPSDRAAPVHPARREPFREHRGAATESAARPADPALRPRGDPRVPAGVLRQPRVHRIVPGHPQRGHRVRLQRARGRRRWLSRVPRARHRLSPPPAPGGSAVRRGVPADALADRWRPRPGDRRWRSCRLRRYLVASSRQLANRGGERRWRGRPYRTPARRAIASVSSPPSSA